MAILRWLTVVAAGATLMGNLPAKERLAVPVPSSAGRVSLGVFDAQGRLVRALAQSVPVAKLSVGLDGLIFEWDGRDEQGAIAPAGPWIVRGYFIPDRARSRGEGFHFNDWVEGDGKKAPARVLGLIPLADTRFVMAGKMAGSGSLGIWECDQDQAIFRAGIAEAGEFLAGSEQGMAVWDSQKSELLFGPLFEAPTQSLGNFAQPPPASLAHQELWILNTADARVQRLLPNSQSLPAPSPAELLAAAETGIYFSGDGKVWFLPRQGALREIPMNECLSIWSLAAGPAGTLWFTGRDVTGAFLRQVSVLGEVLRALQLEPPVTHAQVFADPQKLRVFLLENRGGSQRVLGLQPAPSPSHCPGVADWEIFCDRSITPFEDFGFRQGEVVPRGAEPADSTFSFRLSPSNWEKNPGPLKAQLEADEDGLWLSTAQGLRLLKVCQPTPERFVASVAPGGGELRVLVGREAVVEEFVVENLNKILPLDAGELK